MFVHLFVYVLLLFVAEGSGCASDLGTCVNLESECWCYFEKGTVPSSVCGYSSTYDGEYYSLDTSSVNEPTIIISALGKTPQADCTDEVCADDCLSNVCNTGDGCTGKTSQPCASYIADLPWQRTNRAGIVRCAEMENIASSSPPTGALEISQPSSTSTSASPTVPTSTSTSVPTDPCFSDYGFCVNLKGHCWCHFEQGTQPSAVCGHPSDYDGKYFAINESPVHTPISIINALGQTPQNDCSEDDCAGNCLSNVCENHGCTGVGGDCPTYVTDTPWQKTDRAGIVRCTTLETKTQCPTNYPFAYRASRNFDTCCSTNVDCTGVAWSEGGNQECCQDDKKTPCPKKFGCVDNAQPTTAADPPTKEPVRNERGHGRLLRMVQ